MVDAPDYTVRMTTIASVIELFDIIRESRSRIGLSRHLLLPSLARKDNDCLNPQHGHRSSCG